MTSKYMTKKTAEKIFKTEIYPNISKSDKPAARYAWNTFIDGLNKDGQISDNKAANWLQPKYIR